MFNSFEFYFRPQKWEGDGSLYKLLGVVLYKKLIVRLGVKAGQKPGK